uniref:Uncharacterized protein n=1 Tax=Brassica oleracea TaxID=3712 RepID=A0A3P6CE91_BRAOL|nr:unnamed protein product [Brassica oleracea]
MENPVVVHKVHDGPWLHQTERTPDWSSGRSGSVRVFCLFILDCLSDSKSRGGWLNDLGYGRQIHTFYDYND